MAQGSPVRRSIRHNLALASFGLLGFCASGIAPAFAADTSLEFAIKAAFIYKFVPYVAWPPTTFAAANTPVVICVIGNDGVGAQLDQAAAGQHAGNQPIVLRHVAAITRDGGCNILYIADADPAAVTADLAAVKSAPVLTVTDQDRTAGASGVIAFTVVNNHVRFDIDDAAAAADGLAISSKLLSLAHSVKQRS